MNVYFLTSFAPVPHLCTMKHHVSIQDIATVHIQSYEFPFSCTGSTPLQAKRASLKRSRSCTRKRKRRDIGYYTTEIYSHDPCLMVHRHDFVFLGLLLATHGSHYGSSFLYLRHALRSADRNLTLSRVTALKRMPREQPVLTPAASSTLKNTTGSSSCRPTGTSAISLFPSPTSESVQFHTDPSRVTCDCYTKSG